MNLDGFLLVVRKTDFEKSANRFLKLDEDKLTIKLRVYRLPDVNHGGFSGDEANQSCPALRIVSQFRPTKSLSSRTVRMGAMLIGRRRAGRGGVRRVTTLYTASWESYTQGYTAGLRTRPHQ